MINSRLPDVGTTIFTVMSHMAKEYGAINLSQGFPDFPIDPNLVQLVYKYMVEGYNQYAPMPGDTELLEAICIKLQRNYKKKFTTDTITVTCGATEGLYASIAAVVRPGDEVIVFDPSYDSYGPAIRLNGGIPVHLNLYPPSFKIDWDLVQKAITPRTKLIIVNTPHNPTGTILQEEDIRCLEKIVQQNGLIVLSDEVYEHIIFDKSIHQSVLRSEILQHHSMAVFSFGKTFHATGWRVGYVVAPSALSIEIRKTHQFIAFSIATPIQRALAEYLEDADHYIGVGEFYEKKRDYFLAQLKNSRFEPLLCRGTYFQVVSYKKIGALPELEMAKLLTQCHGVAAIPISVFYKENLNHQLLRFCFAKQEDTLSKAGEILRMI